MTSPPFFARLIVLFAILLALIVAVCGGVIYVSSQRAVRDLQTQQLRQLTPLIRDWVAGSTPDAVIESAQTQQRFKDASNLLQMRITLVRGDGRVILDTHQSPSRMDNHNHRPEVIDARRTGSGMIVRHSNTIDEDSIYVAELVDPADPGGMIVRASFPQRAWTRLAVPGWQVIGGGVVTALLAVGLLWVILQRRWVGPTQDLVRTADRLAAGQWHARAEPRGAEQLQFFSTRLNLVASHAQQQLADLNDQRADLQALVDTLPDPVLLTAPDGKVMLINLPAAQLLNVSRQQALGQNVVQVVSDEAVLQMVDRVSSPHARDDAAHRRPGNGSQPEASDNGDANGTDDPRPLTRVIRLNRDGQYMTFQAVGKRTANSGVLLVLRDVTALAGAVQMKTDFVANASHELRTPISAIKIAFETLREVYGDDAVQAERCMGIIDGHLKRLEAMLGDLLDLSRVENPNLKPHVKRLKTSEVLAHVRSSLGPMARQKLVELRLGEEAGADNAAAEPLGEFLCDERLLGLVIKNLVENAVKFTPPGGSVTLTLRRGEATEGGEPPVLLTVADTGIGIPPEHLDRVFERFYQVDAARSGSAGRGTGLGLAIVKHALAALGGTVEIESTVGEGTTVTCILPQLEVESEVDENLA